MGGWGARAGAAGVAVLLVLGVVGLVTIDAGPQEATSGPATTTAHAPTTTKQSVVTSAPVPTTATSAPTTTARPPELDAVRGSVDALSPIVSRIRKLAFRRPVTVQLERDDAAFRARGLALIRPDPGRVQADSLWLRAVGISDGADTATPAYAALVGGDLPIAMYDASADVLVARPVAVTAYAKAELVHELALALQDQHAELHRPELKARGDESPEAFAYLTSGVAGFVVGSYVSALSDRERNAVGIEAQRRDAAQTKRLEGQRLAIIHLWPYLIEDRLVTSLLGNEPGDFAALDRAFAKPPTSSEQALVVNRSADASGALTTPKADGAVVGEATAGTIRLGMMLELHIDPTKGGTGNYDINGLAGWDNDRYVVWKDGRGRACTRMRLAVEDGNRPAAEERSRLVDTLRQWAAHHGNARIEQETNPVVVSACR